MKKSILEACLEQRGEQSSDITLHLNVLERQCGWIIGKQGSTIRNLQEKYDVKIFVPRAADDSDSHPNRRVKVRISARLACYESAVLAKREIERICRNLAREDFIPASSTNVKLLYVDGMNFATSHFFVDTYDWSLDKVEQRVQQFAKASESDNIEMVVFFYSERLHENLKEWTSRRKEEVANTFRNCPLSMSQILGELFEKNNVRVKYSKESHGLDSLVAYAKMNNAAILSGNKKAALLKHEQDVYADFEVKDTVLMLLPRKIVVDATKQLEVMDSPECFTVFDVIRHLDTKQHLYRRGSASPLTKYTGNPHEVARPYRQILYYDIFGEDFEVVEEFPTWDAETETANLSTRNQLVKADRNQELYAYKDDPKYVFATLFPKEYQHSFLPEAENGGDWYQHVHSCISVIVEIYCWFSPAEGKPRRSFLEEMRKAEKWCREDAIEHPFGENAEQVIK